VDTEVAGAGRHERPIPGPVQQSHRVSGDPAFEQLPPVKIDMSMIGQSPEQRRLWGVRPAADELWRLGTDPYTGRTYCSRAMLSLGVAAALLAELMLMRSSESGITRQMLTCFSTEAGRPVLRVDYWEAKERPPRDPLLADVLADILEDARDTRRSVYEFSQYLAESAYEQVAKRLSTARIVTDVPPRRGLLGGRLFADTQRRWAAVDPSSSINAMLRLPRELRQVDDDGNKRPIPVSDRVLLGLVDALDLTATLRRESAHRFAVPSNLRLPDDLQLLIDTTRTAVAASARLRGR
jgi:hypothetical protein